MERDFDKKPYDEQERRVCDYLISLSDSMGCGEDPIGFLIASHNAINEDRKKLNGEIDNLEADLANLGGRSAARGEALGAIKKLFAEHGVDMGLPWPQWLAAATAKLEQIKPPAA